MIDAVIAELKELYRIELEGTDIAPSAGLSDNDVQRWSVGLALSRANLYDEIGLYLARGFHRNELPYEFCDNIVNDIQAVIIQRSEIRPELYWSIYLAFDCGEYYRKPGEDPVTTYTRPQIAKIVSNPASHGHYSTQ